MPDQAIRPFQVQIPAADLAELRGRIDATRWPDRETVADRSQGVQLATIAGLAHYWATNYDWREFEGTLNALPQFVTEIDGLDIHFIHVRHAWLAGFDRRATEDHRSADQPDGTRRKRGGCV